MAKCIVGYARPTCCKSDTTCRVGLAVRTPAPPMISIVSALQMWDFISCWWLTNHWRHTHVFYIAGQRCKSPELINHLEPCTVPHFAGQSITKLYHVYDVPSATKNYPLKNFVKFSGSIYVLIILSSLLTKTLNYYLYLQKGKCLALTALLSELDFWNINYSAI